MHQKFTNTFFYHIPDDIHLNLARLYRPAFYGDIEGLVFVGLGHIARDWAGYFLRLTDPF